MQGRASGPVALALALALGLGCASPEPPDPSFFVEPEEPAEYVIGAGDLLRVSVWRQPELTLDSVAVRPDGRISVPLIDDVDAEGKTPKQLKGTIEEGLKPFVREPLVTVVVLESRSRRVFITGSIARQGAIPLAPGMRIYDAISIAGGLGPFADPTGILILREQENSAKQFTFDYNAYVAGDNVEQNVLLRSGDRIVVPERTLFNFLP